MAGRHRGKKKQCLGMAGREPQAVGGRTARRRDHRRPKAVVEGGGGGEVGVGEEEDEVEGGGGPDRAVCVWLEKRM